MSEMKHNKQKKYLKLILNFFQRKLYHSYEKPNNIILTTKN